MGVSMKAQGASASTDFVFERSGHYNQGMADSSLERTLAALSPDLKKEVEDFAAFLLTKRGVEKSDATGEAHPLAGLAGAWRDEPLPDEDLLPQRTLGRHVEL